jgi:ATP-dependent DNA ligase
MLWRSSAPKRQPPGFIEPCIPTPASKPPVGPDWIHEIKHDGYRLIVRKKDDRVRCKLGFEGIVSKHRQSAYRAGPSKAWLKIKNPSAPGVLRFKEEAEP